MVDWPFLGWWPASCLRAGPSRPIPAPCPPPSVLILISKRAIMDGRRKLREIFREPLAPRAAPGFVLLSVDPERSRPCVRHVGWDTSERNGSTRRARHGQSVEVLERG